MSDLQDKTLVCKECNGEFIFTASEQKFYREKGFENEPTRCPECRSKRQKPTLGRLSAGGKGFKETFSVNCSQCGKQTTVPFKPVQNKPVYCRECYQDKKAR
ncbi:MAG TPA: zinc-ribbon domain containing protein [Candidatus Wallbacteria bacterium]|nr:zinc-ribbon domain containing protein [Candidatus Wallbacteria bacterium]